LNATNGYYTGIVTAQTFRVIGDFQVDGTTTTLDTEVTSVDKLEVGANNNTVGVAITQSGTGDILNLYDGSTAVFSVKDGGNVTLGTNATYANDTANDLQVGQTSSSNSGITIGSSSQGQIAFADAGANRAGLINYNHGSDAMIFYTNGPSNERLRITSGGAVNIGSSSAVLTQTTYKLQVETATNKRISFGSAAHDDLSDEGPGIFFSRQSDGSPQISGIFGHGNTSLGLAARDSLTFHAGGTSSYSAAPERLRITSAGLVGIGTDNPDTQLQVFGSSTTGQFKIGGGNGAGNHRVYINCHETNSYIDSYGNNAYRKLRINAAPLILNDAGSGSVGIGSETPRYPLEVNSGNLLVSGSAAGNLILEDRGVGDSSRPFYVVSSDGGKFVINRSNRNASGTTTSSVNSLTLSNGGNLGLGGQTSPGSNIHIGDISANGYELRLSANALTFNRSSNSYIDQVHDTGSILFRMTSSHTEAMRITSGGSVAIGGVTPSDKLHVGGNNAFIRVDRPNGNPGLTLIYNSTNSTRADIDVTTGGDLRFATNSSTERLRIDADGTILTNAATIDNTSSHGVIVAHAPASNADTGYKSIEIGNSNGNNSSRGSTICGQPKSNSHPPYTLIGCWDTGTDADVYYGGGWGSNMRPATRHRFYTNSSYPTANGSGTERLRITGGGFVNIGGNLEQTSYTAQVTRIGGNTDTMMIKGNVGNAFIRFADNDASSDFTLGSDDGSGAGTGAFILYDRNNSVYRVVVNSSGNIGVRNAGPSSKVHIGDLIGSASNDANTTHTSLIIKQTNNDNKSGFYIERSGERKGYYMWMNPGGGSGDGLTFTRNNNGTKSDAFILDRDANLWGGGTFYPLSDNSYDLGSSSNRWRNVYTTDLQLSNEGSQNDVDGTWGSYTIQEGEDELFLINRRNGKKYKFNLTEVN
jgi:hypothetical protein